MTTLPSSSSSLIGPSQPSAGSVFSLSNMSESQVNQQALISIKNAFYEVNGNFSDLSVANQEQLGKLGSIIADVDMSFKKISEENLEEFTKLFPHLKQLSLYGTAVADMPLFTELEDINISYTNIATLPQYRTLRKIELIGCREFSGDSIETLLALNKGIQHAYFASSKLKRITSSLPELVFLDCSYCFGLMEDGLNMLGKSPKLDTLILTGTSIQALPEKLPVRKLDLDCCKNLHNDMFKAIKTYPNLTDLAIDLVYVGLLKSSTVKHLEVTLNDFRSTSEQIAQKVAKIAPEAFSKIQERCPKLETVVLRVGELSVEQKQSIQKQFAPLRLLQNSDFEKNLRFRTPI